MVDFWERRIDVLVCTTIVEAGIDVSTANTLIIDRADRMGLSQLHQLRGRVGRSRERGYAYFLYPTRQAAHRDPPTTGCPRSPPTPISARAWRSR
jgi:transcription-repair coupling factor (superfamily II helicase)